MLKSIYIIIAILILYPALVSAESLSPILKNGSCPSGYHASGKYCTPGKDANFAIIKVGSCPSGYHSSGNYCLACNNAKTVFLKAGNSCPSGYHSSGQYCLEN
jgi:hypothetical protein